MNKEKLRKKILDTRNNLSKEQLSKKSNMITIKFLNSIFYKKSEYIMTYIDFRNEVKTKSLINESLQNNKKIIIPISMPKTYDLKLSQLKNYDKELTLGTYGILEPKQEFIREVSPKKIDLVIVPGVVFSRNGHRIGYGAGYYDRFLTKVSPSTLKVALCFDLQIVNKINHNKHDIPMDYIITENEIIECK